MIGYLITPDGDAGYVDFDNELEALYNLLDCSCIDVVRIADGLFAVVDDEGLLKDDPVPTVYWPATGRMLVGSVLITGDEGRDLGGLDTYQLDWLYESTEDVGGRPVLVIREGPE